MNAEKFATQYRAKKPDKQGFIAYTDEENQIWSDLYVRQETLLPGLASSHYIENLSRLGLPKNRVPQCKEVSEVLLDYTGWQLVPVPALIPFEEFFQLLSERKFPAASFMRCRDEMEYLREPDMFHEIFGHVPGLIDPGFADFAQAYGKAGLNIPAKDRDILGRLYWFTIEFGLIKETDKNRAYGAGIVSSIGELSYSINSEVPVRKSFDPVDILRTPYRIDIFQSIYFILESYDQLFELAQQDLLALVVEAKRLGMHEPIYPPYEDTAGNSAISI